MGVLALRLAVLVTRVKLSQLLRLRLEFDNMPFTFLSPLILVTIRLYEGQDIMRVELENDEWQVPVSWHILGGPPRLERQINSSERPD